MLSLRAFPELLFGILYSSRRKRAQHRCINEEKATQRLQWKHGRRRKRKERGRVLSCREMHYGEKGVSRVFSGAIPGKRLFLQQHMSDRFSQPEQRSGSPRQNPLIPRRAAPFLKPSLERGIGVVIFLAFGSGALLLANDLPWPIFTPFAHAPI